MLSLPGPGLALAQPFRFGIPASTIPICIRPASAVPLSRPPIILPAAVRQTTTPDRLVSLITIVPFGAFIIPFILAGKAPIIVAVPIRRIHIPIIIIIMKRVFVIVSFVFARRCEEPPGINTRAGL